MKQTKSLSDLAVCPNMADFTPILYGFGFKMLVHRIKHALHVYHCMETHDKVVSLDSRNHLTIRLHGRLLDTYQILKTDQQQKEPQNRITSIASIGNS